MKIYYIMLVVLLAACANNGSNQHLRTYENTAKHCRGTLVVQRTGSRIRRPIDRDADLLAKAKCIESK